MDTHRLYVPDGARLIRSIRLTFCEVRQYRDRYAWTWTQFPDGSGYGATPDRNIETGYIYEDRARRVGCEDVDDFCFQHDFVHSFLSEKLNGRPSPVLWALAHKKVPVGTAPEESLVIHFQEFLNGVAPNDIMEGADESVDWYALRHEARSLIAKADDPVRDAAATVALR